MSTHSHLEIRKRRRSNDDVQQQMTPMIDVVFQLLIFFIVTLEPADIYSNLAASRPAPQKIPVDLPELLSIGVFDEHYLLNGKNVTLDSMDEYLSKLGSISSSRGVIVKCAPRSSHARLIRVLNLCEKTGFDNISLFSY